MRAQLSPPSRWSIQHLSKRTHIRQFMIYWPILLKPSTVRSDSFGRHQTILWSNRGVSWQELALVHEHWLIKNVPRPGWLRKATWFTNYQVCRLSRVVLWWFSVSKFMESVWNFPQQVFVLSAMKAESSTSISWELFEIDRAFIPDPLFSVLFRCACSMLSCAQRCFH